MAAILKEWLKAVSLDHLALSYQNENRPHYRNTGTKILKVELGNVWELQFSVNLVPNGSVFQIKLVMGGGSVHIAYMYTQPKDYMGAENISPHNIIIWITNEGALQ